MSAREIQVQKAIAREGGYVKAGRDWEEWD